MKIIVNGKEQYIEKEINITDLLVKNNVDTPDMVSVQLNGEFVRRENFQNTIAKENDEIDFLYFMGGGK
ncbi:sulfur carrier protein ThiS [Candidatus Desantisbacteria bacterium]|nr:sulfur carrier protein ThiS [Candidatus Desantisbacteria bacterium]